MKGIVVYCPNEKCRKPLLRDAYIRIGTRFSLRCFACGAIVKLEATDKGMRREIIESSLPEVQKGGKIETEEDSCFMVIET